MNKIKNHDIQLKQKVVTLLNRQQIDFLDKIGKDMLFYAGRKLSRSKIISILVNILLEHKEKINTKEIRNSEHLKEMILDAIKGTKPEDAFPSPYQILATKEKELKEQSLG